MTAALLTHAMPVIDPLSRAGAKFLVKKRQCVTLSACSLVFPSTYQGDTRVTRVTLITPCMSPSSARRWAKADSMPQIVGGGVLTRQPFQSTHIGNTTSSFPRMREPISGRRELGPAFAGVTK
ncbi:hypothetical protein [Alteriqipengyuania sp. 357]